MKPVGLVDPRTGRRPFAVVQLRQDNLAASHFSMVGFQTQLKWGEQKRVFRMIPGLENAEFVRHGMIHRNTYVNAPQTLQPTFETRARRGLFFAGQMSGVEGYVESAASGLIAGVSAAARAAGQEPLTFPEETALGALGRYIAKSDPKNYQPTNIAFGLLPELPQRIRDKSLKRRALAAASPGRPRDVPGAGGRQARRSSVDAARSTSGGPSSVPGVPRTRTECLEPHDSGVLPGPRAVPGLSRADPALPANPVDHLAIRSFLAHLHGRGLSKSSSARKLAALRTYFRFLCREGILTQESRSSAPVPETGKEDPLASRGSRPFPTR